MIDVARTLRKLAEVSPHWTEFRFHRRRTQSLQVQKGRVKQARSNSVEGVGIRVLVDGAWGFSSTSDLSEHSLERALKMAITCAHSISQLKRAKIKTLPQTALAKGVFALDGYAQLEKMPLAEKFEAVLSAEAATRKASASIRSAVCTYSEIFEDKLILSSDGADAESHLVRPEFRVSAVAEKDGSMCEGHETIGRTGAWNCLFEQDSLQSFAERAAKLATDLLGAPKIPGGTATLVLSPAMVGLLSHEAIGHTVEADFVLSGSVAAGKLGTRVASDLVSLADSGTVGAAPNAGGNLLVDDEGVPTQKTQVIKNGILTSYLHNRESAAVYGVAPTGNARAWQYSDEPLIRMRNTYVEPGTQSLDEIIASTPDGYLIDGPLGGQADATGEFMFGAQKVTRIENGKLTKMFRGATVSGQAFEVLSTVDAVSKEFALELGSGYCGKGQPAKVDAGGPYLRCKAAIGGVQE